MFNLTICDLSDISIKLLDRGKTSLQNLMNMVQDISKEMCRLCDVKLNTEIMPQRSRRPYIDCGIYLQHYNLIGKLWKENGSFHWKS